MSTGLDCAECGYSGFTEQVVDGLGKCPRCASWVTVHQAEEEQPDHDMTNRQQVRRSGAARWSLAVLLGMLPFGGLVVFLRWNEHLGLRDTIFASMVVLLVGAGIRYSKYEPTTPRQMKALANAFVLVLAVSLGLAVYLSKPSRRVWSPSPADVLSVTFTPVIPQYSTEVRGTVHNGGTKTAEGVQVTFRLLDHRGRILGETSDYISSIPNGRDWAFTCYYADKRVTSVQVVSVHALGWGKP